MLTIEIALTEGFDEAKQELVALKSFTLELEHSLVSISKWESFWEKPFLVTDKKTSEETLWYVRSMILTPNVPSEVYDILFKDHLDEINAYVNKKMTATWFSTKDPTGPVREVITSELIYYWMISLGVPFECENWHLNRLLTLIQVCNHKNSPQKKIGSRELAERNRKLNAERKVKFNTTG